MKLLFDTFSWKKLDILIQEKLFDLSFLYENHEIYVTHEVMVEVKHFKYLSLQESRTGILPIKNFRIYQDAIDLNFDKADASLLSNGTKDGNTTIVTEDKPLLELGKSYQFYIIQLADLFQILTILDYIERNYSYKLVKRLYDLNNITKNKFNTIKKILYQS